MSQSHHSDQPVDRNSWRVLRVLLATFTPLTMADLAKEARLSELATHAAVALLVAEGEAWRNGLLVGATEAA